MRVKAKDAEKVLAREDSWEQSWEHLTAAEMAKRMEAKRAPG